MSFVEARDRTRLFVKDWGTGRPVLFLHGWPLCADMWEYQMTPLAAAGFRCVAFDRRGFGRSDQPGTGYDFDTFADDLATVIEQLDLRDLTLVGFSMGGGEIARYLARHGSERVGRVALAAAALAPMDEGVAAMMQAAIAADRPKFLTDGVPSLFAGSAVSPELMESPVSPALMEWIVGLALRASPLATLACIRVLAQTDFTTALDVFTMPTLMVHGDADISQPVAVARAAAKAIPRSRLLEYAGAPHGLFLTDRARFATDLIDFVRGRG